METIQDKLAKIYKLVQQGATEGERAAAKKALDRIMKKYNLDPEMLKTLELKERIFKYVSTNERVLLTMIIRFMVADKVQLTWITDLRQIRCQLKYEDWVTVEASYEYFRRHMLTQWKKLVKPRLFVCRKAKTKRKLRVILDDVFVEQYIIKSGLIPKELVSSVDPSELTKKEKEALWDMQGLEGGQYNKQVVGGLLLTE